MNKGILLTLPRYDIVTEYLSQFSYELEKVADNNGIKY